MDILDKSNETQTSVLSTCPFIRVLDILDNRERLEIMAIYFVHATGTDHVKIGFTAGDPLKRMSDLQTGCPHRLVLLVSIPGTEQDEGNWHREFAANRVNGEWFQLTPQLMVRIILAAVGSAAELQERIDSVENAVVSIEQYLCPLGFVVNTKDPRQSSVATPKPPSQTSPAPSPATDWWAPFLRVVAERFPILAKHLSFVKTHDIRPASSPNGATRLCLYFPSSAKDVAEACSADANVNRLREATTSFFGTAFEICIYGGHLATQETPLT